MSLVLMATRAILSSYLHRGREIFQTIPEWAKYNMYETSSAAEAEWLQEALQKSCKRAVAAVVATFGCLTQQWRALWQR